MNCLFLKFTKNPVSGMKKKYIIINVLLSMAVLFSILFQAVHAYGHHSEEIAEKIAHHHSDNKDEINQNAA